VIYQHRSQGGDRRIATALEILIESKDHVDPDDEDPDDGLSGVLVPKG
jgi:hypothetical protein